MLAVATALSPPPQAVPAATFGACYQAHAPRVFRWALRFGCGSRPFAEDLTHDVFLKLLQELPKLDRTEDVGGWLYRVTANLALSRLRRERSFLARLERAWSSANATSATPEERVLLHDDARRAAKALEALPAKERVVLSMKVLDGKSQREIAEALSMSEGYVSKVVSRAWERLNVQG